MQKYIPRTQNINPITHTHEKNKKIKHRGHFSLGQISTVNARCKHIWEDISSIRHHDTKLELRLDKSSKVNSWMH